MPRTLTRLFKLVADDFSRKQPPRRFSAGVVTTKPRLEGRVAIITGGASGLGKATANEFIKHGAQVIIADINPDTGSQAAKDLGPAAQFLQCDVTIEAQVAEAVHFAIVHHGKLDIMYNNAGILGVAATAPITDLDLDEFDEVMRVNVRGVMAGIKHAARVMIPTGSGSILCTSSTAGLIGGVGPHPYSASKSTIPALVRSVAGELCRSGVRINCISPGPIATPLAVREIGRIYPRASEEKVVEIVDGLSELKGVKGEDVDIAKAALYLASDEAKFVTGQNLVVDGGFTCFKHLAFPSPDQIVTKLCSNPDFLLFQSTPSVNCKECSTSSLMQACLLQK